MARTDKTSVKFGTTVSYISYQEIRYGSVEVFLEAGSLKVADVPTVMKAAEKLSFVQSADASLVDGGVVLRVALKPTGSSPCSGNGYDSPERRKQLMDFFAPTSVRKVSATAVVVRDAAGRHLQTQVTLHLTDGESFKSIDDPRVLNGKGGVLRSRIGEVGSSLIFTMSEPAIDDVDGAITKVIQYVAGKVETMYVGQLSIQDRNPDASLNPSNDFASSDNSQA
jgi:hypothetical protein